MAYGGYKLYESYQHSQLTDDPYAGYYSQEEYGNNFSTMQKEKQIDERLPGNPDRLLNNPDWTETSHPDAKEHGHRTFENTKTGEKLRYVEAKPEASGHKGDAHWHRHNPNTTNRFGEYLDANDVPVPRNSPDSHLYPHE